MCGEEIPLLPFGLISGGTPPRVWGRDSGCTVEPNDHRDTPTCVGKSGYNILMKNLSRGHPHVCGEESNTNDVSSATRGTPPRVWGRVFLCLWNRKPSGDTPTCVGKSDLLYVIHDTYQGHPHVCGEENAVNGLFLAYIGTPPRVWGRDFPIFDFKPFIRDTPTCVGKSYRQRRL